MAQLHLRDIPLLRPPGQADLLQVLWCPYDHDPNHKPSTALFWRSAAEVRDVLATPPEPYEVNWEGMCRSRVCWHRKQSPSIPTALI
ncbi:hypothetical protein AB9Q10_41705 [Streptomyces krungchingensis]|uniref:hypothetical protein n=1 Tax=Streptomyces krungchingensis TaxID=1565034 RepID=UPI003CE8F17E